MYKWFLNIFIHDGYSYNSLVCIISVAPTTISGMFKSGLVGLVVLVIGYHGLAVGYICFKIIHPKAMRQ